MKKSLSLLLLSLSFLFGQQALESGKWVPFTGYLQKDTSDFQFTIAPSIVSGKNLLSTTSNLKETFQQNRYGAVHTVSGGDTAVELHTSHIFNTGNRFIYLVKGDYYFLPKNQKSWQSKQFEYYLRLAPQKELTAEQLIVGGIGSATSKIHNIRFTDKTTEVTIKITPDSTHTSYGTMHPPGSNFAFVLTDSEQNRYHLLDCFGWEGDTGTNYGKYSIPSTASGDKSIYFIIFMEPVKNSNSRFNLVEGNCSSGCWNFYDIRAK